MKIEERETRSNHTRKQFIKKAGLVTVAVILGCITLLVGCRFLEPEGGKTPEQPVIPSATPPVNISRIASLTEVSVAVRTEKEQLALFEAELRQFQREMDELDSILAQYSRSNELSEELSLKLQMTMDRRAKFISTLSQMMKKISSTQDILVQNLK